MSLVRTLAAAQLRADLRHPRSGSRSASRVVTTGLAYAVSGVILALTLGDSPPEQVVLVGGSFGIVLAAFGVVGSYDELMGRPKENAWLTTLPASERQHYGARLVGIAGYVMLMAVCVAVPIGIRSALTHGIPVSIGITGLIALGIVWTSAMCVGTLWTLTLALPLTTLRPVLGTARTLLVGGIVIGYQWLGTSPETASSPWWPGAWLVDVAAGRSTIGLAILVSSTLLFGWAFSRLFADRYFALLAKLESEAYESKNARETRRLAGYERLLTRTGPSRAAYGFAVAAITSDRLVRGRVWPAALLPLGFAAFGWLAGGLGSLFTHGSENAILYPETQLHLSMLVVLVFCAHALIQTLQFSDHSEAAWVFGTLPEVRTRRLQMGAQSALIVRVLFPLHLVLWAVLMFQMPLVHAAIHALYWFALIVLVTRCLALLYRTPPFSRRSDRFSAASRFIPLLISAPVGILALFLQMATFQSIPMAMTVSGTMLGISALLGVAARWLDRRATRPGFIPALETPLELAEA
ncbi:MAG: hypothetical protein AAF170_06390 [Bacteroidota bacterium]